MILSAIAALMIGTPQQAKSVPIGSIFNARIETVSGKSLNLATLGSKLTVVLFVTVDCPISNRYSAEYRRLASDYKAKGVGFLLAYVDPLNTVGEIQTHQKEFKLDHFPASFDKNRVLIDGLGPTNTPEAVVLNPSGKLLYRGRIDGKYVEHGKPLKATGRLDLRIALNEVLAGKKVSVPEVAPIGCPIPAGD